MHSKPSTKNKLYLRADGNNKIGLGHVYRLIALIEILGNKFNYLFIIQAPSKNIISLLESLDVDIFILEKTENYKLEIECLTDELLTGNKTIILDGYNFDSEYQFSIKQKNNQLICIDDQMNNHFFADVIINHLPDIQKEKYSCESYTKIFLGLEYAILRKPFIDIMSQITPSSIRKNVLINMGGGDPNNTTLKILKKCINEKISNHFIILLGSSFKHKKELQNFCSITKSEIKIFNSVSATKIIELAKTSKLAICPASTISYELACVGVNMITGYISISQKEISEKLERLGICINCGNLDNAKLVLLPYVVESMRNNITQNQKKMFDGLQASRIEEIFQTIMSGN